jgi:Cap4, dsDNA endonuclease domain
MTNDAGAETSSNYRFQYLYAALLVMQMYNRKSDSTEIICEIGNDITTKDLLGNITSYQITRTDDTSPISETKIKKSMIDFIKRCDDKNYKAFCLVANQRIGRIATKINKLSSLSDEQIAKYVKELDLDKTDLSLRECFKKMTFRVIQDLLGLEHLIECEIRYFFPQINISRLECIKHKLIEYVQKCSRTAERENSLFHTLVEEGEQNTLKTESRTIRISNIEAIIKECPDIQDERTERTEIYEENLKENDERLIKQFIREANDEDEKTAYTALISLQRMGSEIKIHNSMKLRKFMKASLYDNEKIGYLSLYLDLIKRMLYTSVKIEHDYEFRDYVTTHFMKKIIQATCVDAKYDRSRTNAMQIIDDYDLVTHSDRMALYIKTLIKCVLNCNEERYNNIVNCFTFIIPNNLENTPIIRSKLVRLKKKNSPEHVINRCNDLLENYKL